MQLSEMRIDVKNLWHIVDDQEMFSFLLFSFPTLPPSLEPSLLFPCLFFLSLPSSCLPFWLRAARAVSQGGRGLFST